MMRMGMREIILRMGMGMGMGTEMVTMGILIVIMVANAKPYPVRWVQGVREMLELQPLLLALPLPLGMTRLPNGPGPTTTAEEEQTPGLRTLGVAMYLYLAI